MPVWKAINGFCSFFRKKRTSLILRGPGGDVEINAPINAVIKKITDTSSIISDFH
jgi:hypothetical protein